MESVKLICYQLPKSALCSLNSFDFGKFKIKLIGVYDDLSDFISSTSSTSPDIILLNSLTSSDDLYYLLNQLKIIAPKATKILYSTIHSNFILDEILELGIHKVIHKRIQGENLMKEISIVYNEYSNNFNLKIPSS